MGSAKKSKYATLSLWFSSKFSMILKEEFGWYIQNNENLIIIKNKENAWKLIIYTVIVWITAKAINKIEMNKILLFRLIKNDEKIKAPINRPIFNKVKT